MAVVVLAGSQVWLSHLRYELSLASQRLMAEQEVMTLEANKLGLEIANLTRPERLREIARSKLSMAPPRPMQLLHL
ncbi:MAG: cell division protein FtsL [Mariprofundus sp.]|nr:cell division protein FtsL [Mariprofundus sp.]